MKPESVETALPHLLPPTPPFHQQPKRSADFPCGVLTPHKGAIAQLGRTQEGRGDRTSSRVGFEHSGSTWCRAVFPQLQSFENHLHYFSHHISPGLLLHLNSSEKEILYHYYRRETASCAINRRNHGDREEMKQSYAISSQAL